MEIARWQMTVFGMLLVIAALLEILFLPSPIQVIPYAYTCDDFRLPGKNFVYPYSHGHVRQTVLC